MADNTGIVRVTLTGDPEDMKRVAAVLEPLTLECSPPYPGRAGERMDLTLLLEPVKPSDGLVLAARSVGTGLPVPPSSLHAPRRAVPRILQFALAGSP